MASNDSIDSLFPKLKFFLDLKKSIFGYISKRFFTVEIIILLLLIELSILNLSLTIDSGTEK